MAAITEKLEFVNISVNIFNDLKYWPRYWQIQVIGNGRHYGLPTNF